jgi:RNA polymerase primary sigma factor
MAQTKRKDTPMIKLANHVEPPLPRRRPAGAAVKYGMDAYLASIRNLPLLSREEEQRLFREMANGSPAVCAEAKNAIIRANLRLVVKVALAYRDYGVPVCDLVSEGNLGLLKAVDRFDPDRGVRFSTYAVWWIRQDVRRALDQQCGQVRIPTHLRERIRHYRTLHGVLGRPPEDAETMRECGVNRHSAEEVRRTAQFREISLHAPAHPQDECELRERIPDSTLCPERLAVEAEHRRLVKHLLAGLDERSRMVIQLRFGLSGSAPVSLEKIADRIGLSRERVRQIQQETLSRLHDQTAIPVRVHAA